MKEWIAHPSPTKHSSKSLAISEVLIDSSEIIDLRDNPEKDTYLDIQAYDSIHLVSDGIDQSVSRWQALKKTVEIAYNAYNSNLTSDAMRELTVLELGAGTGSITIGMLSDDSTKAAIISDVSRGMLNICMKKIKSLSARRHQLVLFDANAIPFAADQISLVVGNSVLHHLESFENTLAECHRVLQPGGACIFGEPILDTHTLGSLFASLVIKIAGLTGRELTHKQGLILKAVSNRAAHKGRNLFTKERSTLSHEEDKFQFPVDYIKTLCIERIGFRYAKCHSLKGEKKTSLQKIESIRRHLTAVFRQNGEDESILEEFSFILDSIKDCCLEPMGEYSFSTFEYFVMIK